MTDPLTTALTKLFDYAHLGKLATDFAPGLLVAGDWGNLALAFAATVVGVGVYRNARDQYVGYFIRKTDRMACLRRKLAEEEAARAASI